jgi:hypothetical protein
LTLTLKTPHKIIITFLTLTLLVSVHFSSFCHISLIREISVGVSFERIMKDNVSSNSLNCCKSINVLLSLIPSNYPIFLYTKKLLMSFLNFSKRILSLFVEDYKPEILESVFIGLTNSFSYLILFGGSTSL